MVSIELAQPPLPHRSSHDVLDWGRVVVGTLARAVLLTLLGMALWAAAPALIGWHPTTVMTGSMEPRLQVGDVVVSRPVSPAELRQGQVLLYDDPDQPGELRMHRYVENGKNGTIVTKGDANPQNDSTPIERSAVHGVAFIKIPLVGAPITWLRYGEWHRVVLLALALVALGLLANVDGSLRRVAVGDDDDDASGGPDASGLEARHDPATSLTSAGAPVSHRASRPTRRAARRHERRVRRLRRWGGGALVVVAAGVAGVLLPAQALAAPFSKTTVNPTSAWTATTAVPASALTCTNNADGNTVQIGWTYGGVTTGTFDVLTGTTVVASAPGTATSVKVTGASLLALGTYTLNLRTNLGGTWTVVSTASVKVNVISLLGLASARCA